MIKNNSNFYALRLCSYLFKCYPFLLTIH